MLEVPSRPADTRFQVEWVRCCSDALERLSGIAAILVELYLPDRRGMNKFNRLFRAPPSIPILILTVVEPEPEAKLAVQAGAQDYLVKGRLDPYLLPKALVSMLERAAISEALFEEKERAQVTLDSIGDAVMSTDADGRVSFLNFMAESLTGWTRAEALGHPLEEVFQIVDAATREVSRNPMMMAMRGK